VECIFATIVLLAILIAIIAHQWGNSSGTNDAYAKLAARLGGKLSRGGWFRKPSIQFKCHGAQVEISAHSGTTGSAASSYTQAKFGWPDAQISLEVYPAGVWSRVTRLLGTGSMRIGTVAFDEHFVINTNSPESAIRFLSAGVQWHIDRLCRLFGSGDFYLVLDEGELIIRKKQFVRNYVDLDNFARLSLELFEQALLTRTDGIAFVAGERPDEPPKCLVCGEGVIVEMVICRRCQTPHHKECWHYYGSCSTYGCGETRYEEPRLSAVSRNGSPAGEATRRS
jgi:hypothetical protein